MKNKEYELKIAEPGSSDFPDDFLDIFPEKDIHYYPSYLKLFEDYLGVKAKYAFYGNDKNRIILPYFEKPIIHSANSRYSDLISPWYYGGPIHNIKDEKLADDIFSSFLEEFDKYCEKNNIVSEFHRLNPVFGNYKLFKNNPGLYYDRKIVYIDLGKDLKTLYADYSRHSRKNINRAKLEGLRVYRSEGKDSISEFIRIYQGSMDRKEAKDFYYLNEAFFNNLFETLKDEVNLFQVEYKGKIITSSLELGKDGILYDYLRGSDPEYFPLRPNDILIDEIIKWAKSAGFKYFVLGGGRSSLPEDGLFKFKKSFSATTADFYTYKKIHNLEKYKELCKLSGKEENGLEYEKAGFFPEYVEQ